MGFLLSYFIVFVSLFIIENKLLCFWCKSKVCLVGKTALITGGASGIGYETALALASKGCRVIIADVTCTKKAVQDIIEATNNPNVLGKKLNLASFRSVRDLVAQIYESEPRLDILLNNAGIGNFNICYTEDELDRTMQVNYFGHFLLTHLLLDLLKKSAPSRIVFSSSIVAYISYLSKESLNPKEEHGPARQVHFSGGIYGASKLFMASAAKTFGERLNGTGVTVNAYHPGGTKTNLFFKYMKSRGDLCGVIFRCLTWWYGKVIENRTRILGFGVLRKVAK